jgi:phenylacetate-CoA ligase
LTIERQNGVAGQTPWSWMTRNILLRGGDFVWKQGMIRRLSFLERAQWWGREELHVWQAQQLRTLMECAYFEVPFYRSLFDEHRVDWRAITSPADLRQLPIVTKDMVNPNYPHRTTRDTGLKTYEVSSSGSTGKNFRVREDAETAGIYRASFMLALGWAGWKIGEPHMQTGMTLSRTWDRKLKDSLLRCNYVSAYELDDVHLDEALDTLDRKGIRHLWGYPGSLFYLAKRAIERGWNRPLSTLVTWGDNLFQHYRSTIERAFGTRVFDTYGCAEGFQIAAQCGTGSNYHLQSLDVIVEFLDTDGNPVADGELGDIVVTRLHPGPMPLIRYRIGDVGVSAGEKQCSCGRGFEMLASVQGRDTDVIVSPTGNRLIVHFFTGIIELFPEIDVFQVLQEDVSSMTLRLVPASPGSIDRVVEDRLLSTLRKRGAADLDIVVERVDHIDVAPSGKRRFVISTVARNHMPVPQL